MKTIKMKYPMRRKDGEVTYGQDACVYKIWADEKFMIWKGRAFSKSVSQSSETIERGFRLPVKPGNAFEKLIAHIIERRCLFAVIEPIVYPKNAFEMLKLEQTLLWQERNNPNCVNVSFDSYVPEWIPTGHLESFNEWKQLSTQNI